MKITSAKFKGSALNLEACKDSWLPEFAFVGRSNVGKSSLINALTEKKELAKTSSMPGKTQLINFFQINDTWTLVDLPGYGYAKLSKDKREEFNQHVSEFLNERENLKHIFVLVDARLEPLDGDLAFVHWLHQCKLPFSVIFTKIDKTSDTTAIQNAEEFVAQLKEWKIEPAAAIRCSSKTKKGRGQILNFIESLLPKPKSKKKKGSKPIATGWMQKRGR